MFERFTKAYKIFGGIGAYIFKQNSALGHSVVIGQKTEEIFDINKFREKKTTEYCIME